MRTTKYQSFYGIIHCQLLRHLACIEHFSRKQTNLLKTYDFELPAELALYVPMG